MFEVSSPARLGLHKGDKVRDLSAEQRLILLDLDPQNTQNGWREVLVDVADPKAIVYVFDGSFLFPACLKILQSYPARPFLSPSRGLTF